ncbi:MAG TPA: hypothetical protein PLL23_09700 [Chitinophagaceae bacterium]|nr:hypothetical protein [Chitinophagaceae bacterium]
MKALLLPILVIITYGTIQAQQNDSTKIRLTIDSCTQGNLVINARQKIFNFTVKNSSPVFPLFTVEGKVIGFKCYVNHIVEDEEHITIVKSIFMEKREGDWFTLTASEYTKINTYGNSVTVRVGSDKPLPDFLIAYGINIIGDGEDTDTPVEAVMDTPATKPVKMKNR